MINNEVHRNKGANNVKINNTTGHSIILIIDTMLRIMYREMSYDAIIIDLKTYFCSLSLFLLFFSLDVDETFVFVSCCSECWGLVS